MGLKSVSPKCSTYKYAHQNFDLMIMGSNPGLAIFFLFSPPKMRQKVSLGLLKFGVDTARVRLELTDFSDFLKYLSI